MARPHTAQKLIDRLVMLLRADPTRPLGDAMRIAGWADSTAKAQQSRVKALPEVQKALADLRRDATRCRAH